MTRISKTQNGVKTKYINDVALPLVQVLQETDNAGIIQASYTYGQGLISMNRAGVNAYYHYDGLGSVKQMTDNSGAVVADYTYDSFGNLIASSVTVANTYGFTGQQQFAEADNLVFLRARYYDSSTGRFISRDPIGMLPDTRKIDWFKPLKRYIDGMNLYAYVKNNPIVNIDPAGLDTPGCSIPGGHWGNKCWLDCCNKHDACYAGADPPCASDSWCGRKRKECIKCNDAVTWCFLTHIICFK
jgi:RHS repeat-associated protein